MGSDARQTVRAAEPTQLRLPKRLEGGLPVSQWSDIGRRSRVTGEELVDIVLVDEDERHALKTLWHRKVVDPASECVRSCPRLVVVRLPDGPRDRHRLACRDA